jgi:hypothetical protein
MLRFCTAIVAVISSTLLAVPQTVDASRPAVVTAVDTPCASLRGFVSDVDSSGTNVRSAPRGDAPVVARIPKAADLHDGADPDVVSATLRVVGSHAGWLLVRNVSLGDGVKIAYAFAGPGWISGTLVGFSVGSRFVHAAPGVHAPVRASLFGPDYTPDRFLVTRTYGCRGRWADLLLKNTARPGSVALRGWVGAVCDTQLTTCDNVDLP